MSRIYKLVAGALGAVVTALLALLAITQRQKHKAEEKAGVQKRRADSAEARIDQRQKADTASQEAKEEGDARIDEVREEARSGKRDHFSSDSLHDDK